MTSARPTAPPTRTLTRSATDRKLLGVCGGVGEYLGVDPLVIRIVTVVLAMFGGFGIVLYLAGAAVMQEPGRDEPWTSSSRLPMVILAALVALVLLPGLWLPGFLGWGDGAGWLIPVGFIVLLVVLAKRPRSGAAPAGYPPPAGQPVPPPAARPVPQPVSDPAYRPASQPAAESATQPLTQPVPQPDRPPTAEGSSSPRPADAANGGDAPAGDAPVGDPPAGDAPVGDAPVGGASASDAATSDTSDTSDTSQWPAPSGPPAALIAFAEMDAYGETPYPGSGSYLPPSYPPTTYSPVPAPPRQRSYLGALVLSASVIWTGVALTLNILQVTAMPLVVVLGVALAILGAGMLVGSVWGRTRWLVVPAIPLALLLWGVASVPDTLPIDNAGDWLVGGVGSPRFVPTGSDREDFRLGVGSATIDVGDWDDYPSDGAQVIDVSVGLGELVIYVPADWSVTVNGELSVGELVVDGRATAEGAGIEETVVVESAASDARDMIINAEIDAGSLRIVTDGSRAPGAGTQEETA